jgi:ABC-type nitrate/sulfonate/bicarbonate transport system substrate-binding protein
MKLDLALEWFVNPDHLPLIAPIDRGWFADAGLEVSLIAPDDHYDGLAAVESGDIALACNEPLHMIDAHRPGLRALGCFFETDGGILLMRSAIGRLEAGEPVTLASPVAGGVTDAIAVDIVRRWFDQRSVSISREQVRIEAAGFEHLDNLRAGYDGAWLCFANFEGVEARHHGVDARFITTAEVGLENFSALELFTGAEFLRRHAEVIATVTDLVSRGAALCRDEPATAREIWYRYSGEPPSALGDAIVADTCHRLVPDVQRDPERWRAMWAQFERLGLSAVDERAFERLYA